MPGAFQFINYGVRPVGTTLGGLLGATIGVHTTLWIATVGALAGLLFLLPSPIRRFATSQQPRATSEGPRHGLVDRQHHGQPARTEFSTVTELSASPSIREGVKLELGVRGGTLPGAVERTVRSYVAEYIQQSGIHADFLDLASVVADALAPVRTLAEKLALLHNGGAMAISGDDSVSARSARHFYDVYRLLVYRPLSDDDVVRTLGGATSMAAIAADVDENTVVLDHLLQASDLTFHRDDRTRWPVLARRTAAHGPRRSRRFRWAVLRGGVLVDKDGYRRSPAPTGS